MDNVILNNDCSNKIIDFNHIHNKDYNNIISSLYERFIHANNYVANLKKGSMFKYKLSKIDMISQIPKSNIHDSYFLPNKIKKYIDDNASYYLYFSQKIKNKHVSIFFVGFNDLTHDFLYTLNQYVFIIYMWIYIIEEYSNKNCSKSINLYVYLTPFTKIFPDNHLTILDTDHINTGFTTGCKENTDIILYRQEEWFKVFLHETFHCFGLDFSNMKIPDINTQMMKLFNVNIEYNLYESYCEVWARIINVMFYTFIKLDGNNKLNKSLFLSLFSDSIHNECLHSLSQCIKVLHFMDLNFNLVTRKTSDNISICNILYKENTSVFSYYVISGILLNNYDQFIHWCSTYNTKLLQFDRTHDNINAYINLIRDSCKKQDFKHKVKLGEKCLTKIANISDLDRSTYNNMKSLRMSSTTLHTS